jgi:hypothetical protein
VLLHSRDQGCSRDTLGCHDHERYKPVAAALSEERAISDSDAESRHLHR